MKRSSYRDRDFAFGQIILTLRTAMNLTQTGLADFLGISRRAVGEWEAGSSYPKVDSLKQLITLALQQRAFSAGNEVEEIRALWQAARQKVLLDERWLAALLMPQPAEAIVSVPSSVSPYRAERNRGAAANLPLQLTPFIGRIGELAELARILGDPACRLLTLIGPGGVGKTRLSLEVAAAQANNFADGVIFVPLASVGTPNQIGSAIGDALHLSHSGQVDPVARLLDYLHDRHLLLVLDNFEHLLEGADLVYDILERAPRITLLITSRERLNLRAEWLFDVEGLSFPQEEQSGASAAQILADLTDYSAIQLFVQRATQVQPGFPLLKTNLTTIARICQHVVGMPLAIELAAAGVRIMPVGEIDRQIRSNLDVLSTTLRDVPARHRSMRAVFDHSWKLLTEADQALLSRLGVFRGSFPLSAAEQIADASFSALMRLVDKSLLRQESAESRKQTSAEPRFFLLEPIREYALEKLAERGELETIQHAHLACYLALAEVAQSRWETPESEAALKEVDRDLDNMRAALHWTVSGGDPFVGLQLAEALVRFWRSRAYLTEARQWLEDLLALLERDARPAVLSMRLRATYSLAFIISDQQDYPYAAHFFEQAKALRGALGQSADETSLLINFAQQARTAGQYQRAVALLDETLAHYRATGNFSTFTSDGFGFVLYFLALILREQGDFVRATALYQECIEFHDSIGDREGRLPGILGLSDIARDRGEAADLRKYSEACLSAYREIGTQWAIGFALNNLAFAAYLEGELTEAAALINESVSMFRAQKAEGSLAEVLIMQGYILWAQGDTAAAHDAMTESLRLALVTGPRLLVVFGLEGLAGVMIRRGQTAQAVHLLSAASTMRTQMGTPVRPVDQHDLTVALTNAQSTLGADAFDALWSEAAQLSLEQVVSTIPGVSPPSA